ncbi:DUF6551 family protein [Pukyongiella litopenaei]|nr:DUF6551 family protein [Pukyongiella litopenaei]
MSLRKVDVSGLEPVSGGVKGAFPLLDFVDIDALVIDGSYQRGIERRGRKNIQKIASQFDWSKFSPLVVSRRPGGQFAIIDGQHRAHAAALRGVIEVPALIVELDAQQEAAAFSEINGTVTALTPNQIYKAALAGFESWAVECDAVVAKAGCRLMPYNKNAASKAPGEVFCVTLVRKYVEAGNAPYLFAVLAGIKASFVADQVSYYNSFGLSALVPAATMNGVRKPEVIAGFLDNHDLGDTERRVRSLQDLPEHRGTSFKLLFSQSVQVLMKAYAQKRLAA